MAQKTRNTNATVAMSRTSGGTFLGTRVGTPEQLKGALALSIENKLEKSYAPMFWIYGPRGEEGWPVKGVCPVVWGYAGVLYTKFPVWLRDELFEFSDRIAKSETGPTARQARVRMLGQFAIEESFHLSEFQPIRKYKDRFLRCWGESPSNAYAMCRDLLNSLKAPSSGIPLMSTMGHASSALESKNDNLTCLRGGYPRRRCDPGTSVRRVPQPGRVPRYMGEGTPATQQHPSHPGVVTMGWASSHIAALQQGRTITFRPHGNSMLPRIKSGALCTVEPVTDAATIQVGDVVLCRVNGSQYLHLVTAREGDRVRISNNHGHHNGWANPSAVYGKLIKVEP